MTSLYFQQDRARLPSCTWHNIELLWRTTADFVAPDMWPPNSPDLNLVDYAIWFVIQQRVHETRVHDIDELQQRLLHVWWSLELQQSLIDDAVYRCPTPLRACVRGRDGHLNILCDYQFVFPVLDELYASHHAAGDVLRVRYKSTKCDISFSQRNVFRSGGYVSYMFKNFFLFKCKKFKNRSRFSNVVMTQMYCHLFMVHSVCAIHTIFIVVTHIQ